MDETPGSRGPGYPPDAPTVADLFTAKKARRCFIVMRKTDKMMVSHKHTISHIMKSCFFALLVLFITLFFQYSATASAPTYDPDHILSFARSLYSENRYQLSLIEYRRFLFSFPTHPRVGEARMGEADCLFWIGEYGEALNKYLDMARDFSLTERGWISSFKVARCYQMMGQMSLATQILERIAAQTEWNALAEQARFDLGWAEIRQGKWASGSHEFQRLSSSILYGAAASTLAEKVPEGAKLPRKSPTTAGILSGILPGAGQLYCEQPKDAALALLLNGLFIWAAVESFNQELYVLGGILVLIETAWYGGNIYNAVNHAHKYNRKVKQEFLSILWEDSQSDLPVPREEKKWFRVLLNIPF